MSDGAGGVNCTPRRFTERSGSGSERRRASSGSRREAQDAGLTRFRRAPDAPLSLPLKARR